MTTYHLDLWKFTTYITFSNTVIHFIPSISIITGTKEYFYKQYFITLSFLKFELQICYDYKFNFKFNYYTESY